MAGYLMGESRYRGAEGTSEYAAHAVGPWSLGPCLPLFVNPYFFYQMIDHDVCCRQAGMSLPASGRGVETNVKPDP